jgi:hypothetical protein
LSNPQPPAQPPFDREDACRAHDKLDDYQTYVDQAAIKAGEFALRMSLLINGGAAIALLTFIGNLGKDKKLFADTLVWFASGVALAVSALALSYFTNLFTAGMAGSRLRTWQHPYIQPGPTTSRYTILRWVFHVAAILFGLASLAAFVCGMLRVRDALTHLT